MTINRPFLYDITMDTNKYNDIFMFLNLLLCIMDY
jgi:hypothetical protein